MAQSNDKYFNQKCPTNRNSPRSPKAPFDTQRVTNIAPSSFGAKCPETRFCRETWVEAKLLKRSDSFPFDQKELLANPVAIQERQAELQAVIKELEESEQEMQTIISLMEEYKSHDL